MATLTLPKISEFTANLVARGSDVLANDQAAATFLNGQNLDQNNINPGMTPVWTGIHVFAADVKINATKKLYFDGGSNTYMYESADNVLDFVCNNAITFQADTDGLVLGSGKNLYFNKTESLYISRSAANIVSFYASGNEHFKITGTGSIHGLFTTNAGVTSGTLFYFDGGVDNYLVLQSANSLACRTGGNLTWYTDTAAFYTGAGVDSVVQSGAKFRFDGSTAGDSYLSEVAANDVRFIVGGSTALQLLNSGSTAVGIGSAYDFTIASGKKLGIDSGGDTYLYESSANIAEFVCGGTSALLIQASQITTKNLIPATNELYDIGSSSQRYNGLHLADSGHIYFGSGISVYFQYNSTSTRFEFVSGGVQRLQIRNDGITTDSGVNRWGFSGLASSTTFVPSTPLLVYVNGSVYRIYADATTGV